jgi:hypothetical protein
MQKEPWLLLLLQTAAMATISSNNLLSMRLTEV